MLGRRLRRLAATVTVMLVVGGGLVTVGASADTGPVTGARHRHRHHHHHDDDCDTPARSDARRRERDEHCGPPPTVPEVPVNVLLPVSGAALTGAVVLGRRRFRPRSV